MDRNSYSLSGYVGTRFSSRNEVERSVGNHSHEAQAVIYNLLFQFALVDSYSKFSETIADAILDQIMYYLHCYNIQIRRVDEHNQKSMHEVSI